MSINYGEMDRLIQAKKDEKVSRQIEHDLAIKLIDRQLVELERDLAAMRRSNPIIWQDLI